jgi:ketosteroid isomerase-like protein
MRTLLLTASLVLATVALPASAQRSGPAAAPKAAAPAQAAPSPAQAGGARIAPAANEAVQVVNAFMAALASGQLESARKLMAPDAVVIANGQVLGDRDAYINGAAKADAAALGTVQRELLRRDAKAGPNLAWVLSEKRLRVPGAAQGPSEVVVETMLLAKTAAGWKISHVHWSGRRAG